MVERESRPTGVLTENRRSRLQNDEERVSDRAKEQARIRLRRRIRNAFLDYSLLFTKLSDKDIRHIFSPESHAKEAQKDVLYGVIDCIALCSIGSSKAAIPFSLILEEAIKRAEAHQERPVENVDISIDITYTDDPQTAMETITIPDQQAEEFIEDLDGSQRKLLEELDNEGVIDKEKILEKKAVPEGIQQWAEQETDT